MTPDLDIELFAGPGGWDEGGLRLGLRPVGIEWDDAACRTAVAAGHLRIRADVATYPTDHLRGKVRGLIASPPCTTFSAAGHGNGKRLIAILAEGVRGILASEPGALERARRAARVELWRTDTKPFRANKYAWATDQAFISCLVLEPARWIIDTQPVWVALEQVPAVLPLWRVYAHGLRLLGYSAFAVELNAADYGVPQTRKRGFMGANRERAVAVPEPSHDRDPKPSLFGQLKHWISMACALEWGATNRPGPTLTAGGIATGGPEPFARGGREALEREREREEVGSIGYRLHRGAGMNERHGQRPDRPIDLPAPVITSKARTARWAARHDA